jgi:hypothetical protein
MLTEQEIQSVMELAKMGTAEWVIFGVILGLLLVGILFEWLNR